MSNDDFLERLLQYKAKGIDLPEIDVFISSITGDTDLLETAINRGADLNMRDSTLIEICESRLNQV